MKVPELFGEVRMGSTEKEPRHLSIWERSAIEKGTCTWRRLLGPSSSLRRYRPLVWDQMGAVGSNKESVVEAELGLGGKLAERVQENDVEAEEEP